MKNMKWYVVAFMVAYGTTLRSDSHALQSMQARKESRGVRTDVMDRDLSATLLNSILSSEFVLLAQTLNYHWNIVGPEFHDYHKLFDDQYKKMFEEIDSLAERIRAVGGTAAGSLSQFLKLSTIDEDTGPIPQPRIMVERLLRSHEQFNQLLSDVINATDENNNDMATSNFLTEILEEHQKIVWMLKSLLGKRS